MPRQKKKVKIIKSKDDLLKFIKNKNKVIEEEKKQKEEKERKKYDEIKKQQEIENQLKEEQEQKKAEEEEKKIKVHQPTEVFIEKYSISGEGKPLEISFEKVKEDTLPLEEVMVEVQESYDRGFEDGKDATQVAVQTEIDKYSEWIRQIDNTIESIQENFSSELKKFEKSLIESVIIASEKILEREISNDSEIIINQVKKAIQQLDEDDNIIKISINPIDYEILENAKSSIVSDSSRLRKTKISKDTDIPPGSCILNTSAGEIDATINNQLSKIKKVLKSTIEENNEQ